MNRIPARTLKSYTPDNIPAGPTITLSGVILRNSSKKQKRIFKFFSLFPLFLSTLLGSSHGGSVRVEQYDPVSSPRAYHWCTQISFHPDKEIIIDNHNDRVLCRQQGATIFSASPLSLHHPHSLVYNPSDQLYYITDTDNHRIIAVDSLENPRVQIATSSLAGIQLKRPHDIVIDPASGWLYAINPLSAVVFRFRAFGLGESALDLSSQHLGYSRALTFSNGKLYVIGSSTGKVVEVTNFDHAVYTVYQSAGKQRTAPAGNWQQTGLVLNDVEQFKDYWYASSYFSPAFSLPGQNYNTNKLIRFKTWEQFQTGNWEDLSHLLPDGLVPYYLTVAGEFLYIPLFNQQIPGQGDCIFRLSTQ